MRGRIGGCGSARALLLETGPTEHWTPLRWPEGDRRLRATLRAGRSRLWSHPWAAAHSLSLALLAMLGIVFELFVVEK